MTTIDHVAYVTPDAAATAADLRARHGLGALRNGYHDHLGTRSWGVPLAVPTYLELLEVENESVAASSPLGRSVLALRDAGGGLAGWSILVDDVDAEARRTGVAPYDGTVRTERGLLGWRTVTGRGYHLPFFITYVGDEAARLVRRRDAYDAAAHDCVPTTFSRIEVSGSPGEYDAWMGPHDLPLVVVEGEPALLSVTIATDRGDVVLR